MIKLNEKNSSNEKKISIKINNSIINQINNKIV